MKFFELFARSAAGSAFAILLYVFCMGGLTVGVQHIVFLPMLWQAVDTGVGFGLFYAVVHDGREPTFLASFLAGIGFAVVLVAVLASWGRWGYMPVSMSMPFGMLFSVLVMALLLGSGAFLSTLIRRSPP
jgi:hypothetical protein